MGCRYRRAVRGEPRLDLKGRVAGSGRGRLGLCNTFGLVSVRWPVLLEVAAERCERRQPECARTLTEITEQ